MRYDDSLYPGLASKKAISSLELLDTDTALRLLPGWQSHFIAISTVDSIQNWDGLTLITYKTQLTWAK